MPKGVPVKQVLVERCGDLHLLVGGANGYKRVRGGQGPDKNQFQGYTTDKKNTTKAFNSAREAAVALAELERDLAAGLDKAARKRRKGARSAPSEPTPSNRPSLCTLLPSYPELLSCARCVLQIL